MTDIAALYIFKCSFKHVYNFCDTVKSDWSEGIDSFSKTAALTLVSDATQITGLY